MYFGPSTGWHGCRFTKPGNECEWGMAGWTAHFDKDSTTFSWRMGNIEFKKGDEILLFSPLQKAYNYRINMFDSSFQNQGLFYNPSRYAFEGKVLNNTKKLFFNLNTSQKIISARLWKKIEFAKNNWTMNKEEKIDDT